MSARKNKKRAQKSVRETTKWWEKPTFVVYSPVQRPNDTQLARVELILPNGKRIDLGLLPVTENREDLHRTVAERFKEIWDPIKNCQRTPTT